MPSPATKAPPQFRRPPSPDPVQAPRARRPVPGWVPRLVSALGLLATYAALAGIGWEYGPDAISFAQDRGREVLVPGWSVALPALPQLDVHALDRLHLDAWLRHDAPAAAVAHPQVAVAPARTPAMVPVVPAVAARPVPVTPPAARPASGQAVPAGVQPPSPVAVPDDRGRSDPFEALPVPAAGQIHRRGPARHP